MIDFSNISKVYFLGIGGIGMSAIARYCLSVGIEVHGYDKTASKLTAELEKEGAIIHFEENTALIPENLDLVIYTPAIPSQNLEFQHFLASNIPFIKRAKALGYIANNHFVIAVAGSHGKTTLTSMIAHILVESGYKTTALIGGICQNFASNFVSTGSDFFVVEADEYDRSFHQLLPNIAIITKIDNDHLEIYPQRKDAVEAFTHFVNNIKKEGRLILHSKEELDCMAPGTVTIGYHLEEDDAHYRADKLQIIDGTYHFTVQNQPCILNMGGKHNVENAIAAFAACKELGISSNDIAKALASFKGIERRFEYIIREDNCVYIDDYAHHPQEIHSLINSVKDLYVNNKIKLIFQPHLYSRTEKLANEFSQALSQADEVVLMEIYPAREKPIKGVNSELILKQLKNANSLVFNTKDITNCLAEEDEVVLTVGAGDIGNVVNDVKEKLLNLKNISIKV